MKAVKFISLPEAEEYSPSWGQKDRVLISLTTPGGFKHHPNSLYCRPAVLPEGVWKDVLRLEFHDADPNPSGEPCGYKLFTSHDAATIIEFLIKHRHVDNCVVHCEGGISRSAGVAKFVAQLFKLEFPESYALYNRHVFSTLCMTHNRYLYGDS